MIVKGCLISKEDETTQEVGSGRSGVVDDEC